MVNNVAAGDLIYGCRVRAGADTVFTGWRRTRVGAPGGGQGESRSCTSATAPAGPTSCSSPTWTATAGASDPNFLSDVGDVLKGAYFGQDYFLANQQNFNFWLADQTGDADRVPAPTPADPSATDCVLTLPGNWATDYSWRDSGAILPPGPVPGLCRRRRRSPPSRRRWARCCTRRATHRSGWPTSTAATAATSRTAVNMFDTLAECQADAMTLGRPSSDCRKITDARPTPAQDWFLSEPTPNDLMNADRRPPQAADIRQMDSFFTKCRAGSC